MDENNEEKKSNSFIMWQENVQHCFIICGNKAIFQIIDAIVY